MVNLYVHAALVAGVVAALFSPAAVADEAARSTHTLPIFFFHGLLAGAEWGDNMKANLSTDARPFVALNFCENACSTKDLYTQVPLALAQIRNITTNDRRFDNGYTFIGHSQGAALARAVIEEMDDHKVHTFISLAGADNGMFYGPQENDFLPVKTYIRVFADNTTFDYSKYTDDDIRSGKLQIDMVKFQSANPQYQWQLIRSPFKSDWLRYNKLYPYANNLLKETDPAQQNRRKTNFLKIQAAHFFASPHDETISPWQASHLAQYNDVSSFEELETTYKQLKIVPMQETEEYVKDTYGLRTLAERGGVYLHTGELVAHSCWCRDVRSGRTGECKWQPVYDKYLYPVLAPLAKPAEPPKPVC